MNRTLRPALDKQDKVPIQIWRPKQDDTWEIDGTFKPIYFRDLTVAQISSVDEKGKELEKDKSPNHAVKMYLALAKLPSEGSEPVDVGLCRKHLGTSGGEHPKDWVKPTSTANCSPTVIGLVKRRWANAIYRRLVSKSKKNPNSENAVKLIGGVAQYANCHGKEFGVGFYKTARFFVSKPEANN